MWDGEKQHMDASQAVMHIFCIDHKLQNLQLNLCRMDAITQLVQEDKAVQELVKNAVPGAEPGAFSLTSVPPVSAHPVGATRATSAEFVMQKIEDIAGAVASTVKE
eukprot:CAMPEP_0181316458 /NCGR_PEP_ID=MMETSP1101-20121128/15906_1 /TAXON_ID=46948 /ORGANISM="Rhodomonas abbreviata, Strain Caron Lab Isolate" /LENGTH=105 /DNA_ID=CAMNT_0023423707 /DNA_START=181 /DNA_END=495 /DNA_ORIENTATION=+